MACCYQTVVCVEESSQDPRFPDLCAAHAVILRELLEGDPASNADAPTQERQEADAR
jgi:hypothetical protein